MTTATATEPAPDPVVPEASCEGGADTPAGRAALFQPAIVRRAAVDAIGKLDPRQMAKNPVMFIVEVGSVLTTVLFVRDLVHGHRELLFTALVAAWLWFTVLFANFAE